MLQQIQEISAFTQYLIAKDKTKYFCKREKDESPALIQKFCELFDRLEREPFTFHDTKEEVEKTRAYFVPYLTAAEVFLEYLENFSSHVCIDKVLQRSIGLRYRIEEIHGGLDRSEKANLKIFSALLKEAEFFKVKQKLYLNVSLTKNEIAKIEETAKYFTFAKLILKSKKICDLFLKWALRDNNGVPQFIEFPATSERMCETFINKRVGFFNPDELAIVKENNQKIICLPFFDGENVKRISILDENKEITLNQQRKLSIKKIFAAFQHKNKEPGDFEYFGQNGIMNWASYEYGAFNEAKDDYHRIDFNKKEWWKELPIFHIVTKQFLENLYKIHIAEGEWVQIVKATRESLDFNLMKRHSYIEMAIPLDREHYALYPFGVYPADFPTSRLAQAMLITRTELGEIAYPDENEFYSQRQHAAVATPITELQGFEKMARLKKYILKALYGQLTFQFGGENCSYFTESFTHDDKKENSYFKMPVQMMKPTHPVIEFLIKCPQSVQSYVIRFMQISALWYGKRIQKPQHSYYKCTFFADDVAQMEQYQPGFLFQQIEKKTREGKITFGNS